MGTRGAEGTIISPHRRSIFTIYWNMTTTDNIGTAFDMQGYFIGSVEWEGTPGPGFQGLTQISDKPAAWGVPPQWTTVPSLTASSSGIVFPSGVVPYAMQVRPMITGGDGTTNISYRLLLVAY